MKLKQIVSDQIALNTTLEGYRSQIDHTSNLLDEANRNLQQYFSTGIKALKKSDLFSDKQDAAKRKIYRLTNGASVSLFRNEISIFNYDIKPYYSVPLESVEKMNFKFGNNYDQYEVAKKVVSIFEEANNKN